MKKLDGFVRAVPTPNVSRCAVLCAALMMLWMPAHSQVINSTNGLNVTTPNGYPCPDYEDWIDWEDATDDDDSFKKEHDRLSGDGGPQNTGIGGDGRNHNKIWGPGRKR